MARTASQNIKCFQIGDIARPENESLAREFVVVVPMENRFKPQISVAAVAPIGHRRSGPPAQQSVRASHPTGTIPVSLGKPGAGPGIKNAVWHRRAARNTRISPKS
jgi:hypothetical protein